VSDGIVSVLDNFIKNEIMSTYVVIRSVNDSIKRYIQMVIENRSQWILTQTEKELKGKIDIAKTAIDKTLELLKQYLDKGIKLKNEIKVVCL
jgi:hypothetical protein